MLNFCTSEKSVPLVFSTLQCQSTTQKSKELAAHMLKSKVYTAFGHVTSLSINKVCPYSILQTGKNESLWLRPRNRFQKDLAQAKHHLNYAYSSSCQTKYRLSAFVSAHKLSHENAPIQRLQPQSPEAVCRDWKDPHMWTSCARLRVNETDHTPLSTQAYWEDTNVLHNLLIGQILRWNFP